jgi:hypothetical protein
MPLDKSGGGSIMMMTHWFITLSGDTAKKRPVGAPEPRCNRLEETIGKEFSVLRLFLRRDEPYAGSWRNVDCD